MTIICCQVPRTNLPSDSGTQVPGPINVALKCENPLSSPHVWECRVCLLAGINSSSCWRISSTSACSYSIVETEAVEPIIKTFTNPFFIPDSETMSFTSPVISLISENPFVNRVIFLPNTVGFPPRS